VSDVERALLSKLSDCKSSSDCQLAVVRSLGNARLPGSVEALIDLSVNSSHAAVSEAALMALTRFDHDLILHSTLVCALYIISASASYKMLFMSFVSQQFVACIFLPHCCSIEWERL